MQTDIFDTCVLLRLRAVAQQRIGVASGDHELLLPAIATECQLARAAFQALGDQPVATNERQLRDADAVLDIFCRVWTALSKLECNHPLHIPPIHKSDIIQNVLRQLTVSFRAREARQVRYPTGHFVIAGVEGTGKTVLVKALAIGIAACSAKYFLAYADYKVPAFEATPKHIIAELVARYSSDDFSLPFGTLRASSPAAAAMHAAETLELSTLLEILARGFGDLRPGFRVGIVAEELQEKVMADAPANASSVVLMQTLEHFARYTVSALLIVTDSSANLQSRLFAPDRDRAYNNYPWFNGSLFSHRHMTAREPWWHNLSGSMLPKPAIQRWEPPATSCTGLATLDAGSTST
jgi:hypothetical protein